MTVQDLVAHCTLAACALAPTSACLGQPGPLNLVRDMAGNSARVSVDSSFPGYVAGVLVDGKWVAPGEEQDLGNGSPDTLGNSGNTWVSAAQPAEHWVRLDWERTVTLNEIAVWWTKDDWRPQAFRVEYLSDESWVPLTGEPVWYRPTERRSALTFAPREVQVVRLIQHAAGGPDRGFLAAQEVLAFLRTDPAAGPAGVRRLTAAEAAQLAPMSFERNLARLDETQPGAAAALAYLEAGATADCPALADGRLDAAAWP